MTDDAEPRAATPEFTLPPCVPDPDAMPALTYSYNPEPESPESTPAGVTKGYVVVWSGEPGDALIAEAVMLVGEDGEVCLDSDWEFTPTTVVDDTPESGFGDGLVGGLS